MKRALFLLVAISTAWGVLAACSSDPTEKIVVVHDEAGAAAHALVDDDPFGPDSEAPPIVSLTEKAIVAIAEAVHDAEHELSVLAQAQALDDRAKDYAKATLEQHDTAKAALARTALESEEGPVSRGVRREVTLRVASLKTLSGRTFDVAYMTAEVTMQTAILGLLNAILVSNYTTPDVNAILRSMRISAANSLREAARIQAEFYQIEGVQEPKWDLGCQQPPPDAE